MELSGSQRCAGVADRLWRGSASASCPDAAFWDGESGEALAGPSQEVSVIADNGAEDGCSKVFHGSFGAAGLRLYSLTEASP